MCSCSTSADVSTSATSALGSQSLGIRRYGYNLRGPQITVWVTLSTLWTADASLGGVVARTCS